MKAIAIFWAKHSQFYIKEPSIWHCLNFKQDLMNGNLAALEKEPLIIKKYSIGSILTLCHYRIFGKLIEQKNRTGSKP